MERISQLIEKLRTTYYQNEEKNRIDLDLMLDYTRTLYADILEWRAMLDTETSRKSSDSIQPEANLPLGELADLKAQTEGNPDITREPEQVKYSENSLGEVNAKPVESPELQTSESIQEKTKGDSFEGLEEDRMDLTQKSKMPEHEGTAFEQDGKTPQEEVFEHKPHAIPDQAANESPKIETSGKPESTSERATGDPESTGKIKKDISSISFEPPASRDFSHQSPTDSIAEKSEESNFASEGKITEAPVSETPIPEPAISKTSIPEVPEKEALPDFKKIYENAPSGAYKDKGDIRKLIGINDKYLYLNELFNNHKSAYEETLDQLNKAADLKTARQFLESEIAPRYKWSREDSTVESFYWVLERHLKR